MADRDVLTGIALTLGGVGTLIGLWWILCDWIPSQARENKIREYMAVMRHWSDVGYYAIGEGWAQKYIAAYGPVKFRQTYPGFNPRDFERNLDVVYIAASRVVAEIQQGKTPLGAYKSGEI
jgi:hypothetical protein